MSEPTSASTPAGSSRLKREMTAIVGVPTIIWGLFWAPRPFFIGILVVATIGAAAETILMTSEGPRARRLIPPLLAVAALLALVSTGADPATMTLWAMLTGALLPLAWLVTRGSVQDAITTIGGWFLATYYVGGLGAAMIAVFLLPDGRIWSFLMALALWGGDAAALYAGRVLGRHKLSPVVSPKKTWEGAIAGGLVSVLCTSIVLTRLLDATSWPAILTFAIGLTTLGQLGDLAESMMKRSAGVKDSSALIPGHGGFLDRVDSLLMSAPLVLLAAHNWHLFGGP